MVIKAVFGQLIGALEAFGGYTHAWLEHLFMIISNSYSPLSMLMLMER